MTDGKHSLFQRPPGATGEFAALAEEAAAEINGKARQGDRPAPQRSALPAVAALACLLAVAIVAAFLIYRPDDPGARPSPDAAEVSSALNFYLALDAIKAKQSMNGTPPATLVEAGIRDPLLIYRLTPGGFELETRTPSGVLLHHPTR